MSIDQNQLTEVMGTTVYSSDGDKIGQVGQVYLDDETGRPEWVTVQTGLFGTKESFVPLRESEFTGEHLRVPYEKGAIKDAPRVDADQGHLSPDEEAELYRHYGLGNGHRAEGLSGQDTGRDVSEAAGYEAAGHDTSGPNTDEAMTRSEERLEVGTQSRESGTARLRKYVVTEEQTVTVPVSREEVRLEREPITDENRDEALSGPDISEEEHEVTLHEERPVVAKEAVPVERVRLEKDTVTENVEVTEDVRKEQIETDGLDR